MSWVSRVSVWLCDCISPGVGIASACVILYVCEECADKFSRQQEYLTKNILCSPRLSLFAPTSGNCPKVCAIFEDIWCHWRMENVFHFYLQTSKNVAGNCRELFKIWIRFYVSSHWTGLRSCICIEKTNGSSIFSIMEHFSIVFNTNI